MNALDSPSGETVVQTEAGKRSVADRHWQTAGDRVWLYLRCLSFPPPQAFELALGALTAAEKNVRLGSGNSPVAEAMQALQRLLNEPKSDRFDPSLVMTGRWESPRPSTPPLHRLPMIAAEMGPGHGRSLPANSSRRSEGRSAER